MAMALSLFLLIVGCEAEEAYVNQNNRLQFKASEKPIEELLKLKGFNDAYQKIAAQRTLFAGRSSIEDMYNFTISDKPVKVVEMDNKTFYNMLIKSDDSISAGYFQNLLIMSEKVNDAEELSAYIIKYMPNPVVKPLEIETLFSRVSMYCNFVCVLVCHETAADNLPQYQHDHTYDPSICSGNNISLECTETCVAEEWPDPIPGTNGGSGNGPPVVVTPPNHSGATQPQLVVLPVMDEPESGVNIIEPCKKLKGFTNNNFVKESLKKLRDEKLNMDREYGYNYNKVGVAYTPVELPPGPNAGSKIDVPTGNNIFGASHTHPNDGLTVPMFSAQDIIVMYNLIKNYNYGINGEVPGSMLSTFVFTLTTVNGAYAMKIDTSLFVALMDNYVTDERKFSKALDVKQRNSSLTASVQFFEKDFLNFIDDNNLGMSLYKANEDLTNWSRLDFNPTNPNQVIPTPCN